MLTAAANGALAFQEVFMFSHRAPSVTTQFVSLHTAGGHHIAASPGHYLWSSPSSTCTQAAMVMRRAADISIDSCVLAITRNMTLAPARVTRKSTSAREGLYNPHTISGTIVVDNVAALTFTDTLLPSLAAHSLVTAPAYGLYAICKSLGVLRVCNGFNAAALAAVHGPGLRLPWLELAASA